MSFNVSYDTGNTPCQEWKNVMFNRVVACDNVSSPNVDVVTINHLPYPPQQDLPTPIPNRFLRTTALNNPEWLPFVLGDVPVGADGQLLTSNMGMVMWGNPINAPVTPGLARQVYQTSADGSTAEWTDDVQVNTDLQVLGTATINMANILGDLQLNGLSGVDQQIIQKNNLGGQDWVTPSFPPTSIQPGNPNEVLITPPGGGPPIWSDSVSLDGTLTVKDTTNIRGDLQFLEDSGDTGDIIRKTGPFTQGWTAPTASVLNPGLPNQVLVTNNLGSAALFSDNVAVPGTLSVTGATTLSSENLTGNLQLAGVSGTSGQILQKTGAATQAWTTPSFPPTAIAHGTANQVFVTDPTGAVSQFTSNVTIPGTLAVTGATTTAAITATGVLAANTDSTFGISSASTANVLSNLAFNGTSGTSGQILQKTGAATQAWTTPSFTPGVITPGTANQIYVTNAAMNATQFASNITVPGTLAVTGATTLAATTIASENLTGNLQFNGVSGTSGQILYKTGAAAQAWITPSFPASAIQPGVANQILITKADSSGSQFSDSIAVPTSVTVGTTLGVTGLATLASENLTGNLQLAGTSGTVGQIIQKTGATTQAWTTPSFAPGVITPGAANQVYVTNASMNATLFSSNLALPGTLSSDGQATFNAGVQLGLGSGNIVNINGNLQTVGFAGVAGNVLLKTAPTTQQWGLLPASSIAPGGANQVLVTNGGASLSTYSNNLVLSGTIGAGATNFASTIITGLSNLQGDLQLNGVSGTTGQVLQKTGAATQAFTTLTTASISAVALKSVATSAVNLGTAATTAIAFGTNVINSGGFVIGGGNTTFATPVAGIYSVLFQTMTSTSAVSAFIDIYQNGVARERTTTNLVGLSGSAQTIQCSGMLNCAANDVITIQSIQNSGGAINTTANQTYIFITKI